LTPEFFVRVTAAGAVDALRTARGWAGRAGSAVDAALLIEAGPAVVAALDEVAPPVFVAMPLSGPPASVGRAAARLARYGAAWVAVSGTIGVAGIRQAVAAVAGTGARIAVVTLATHLDDAGATALAAMSRGKLVSRIAGLAAEAGAAGVVGAVGDLGVFAQVVPGLVGIADGVGSATRLTEARRRQAGAVIIDTPDLLGAPDDAAGSRRSRSGS
jgi:orotidine-5'-phosphate decarboxylase